MSIYRKLRKAYFRGFTRDRFKIVVRDNRKYLVNYKNSIDRKILVDGGYEKAQISFLKSLVATKGCSIFIDIGANIGLYTVKIPEQNTIEKIYAFEPSTRNRYQLYANLLLNGLYDKTEVFPFALSDQKGEKVFLENAGNSTGRSRIMETNINKLDPVKFSETMINVYPMDDLLKIENRKIVLKIDIEGHEEKALMGMKNLLCSNECILQIESYPERQSGTDKILYEYGFTLMNVIDTDRYYSNGNN